MDSKRKGRVIEFGILLVPFVFLISVLVYDVLKG